MAYNKKNYLEKVIKVQEIVIEHQKTGATNTHIYEQHIKNEFNISKRTFDEYLGIPAKRELEKLTQTQN